MPNEHLATTLRERTILLPDVRQLDALESVLLGLGATTIKYRVADANSGIRTIERWLAELVEGEYDDVVFATGQGVHLLTEFASGLGKEKELQAALRAVRVITVGSKPARVLAELGLPVAVRLSGRSAEAMVAGLRELDLTGHVVGVQHWGSDQASAVVQFLDGVGAKPRVVSNAPVGDHTADELMSRLISLQRGALVFTSVSQVTWLFEAAAAAGRDRELHEALFRHRVIATESVADELRARDVRVHTVPSRVLIVLPKPAEVASIFAESGSLAGRTTPVAGEPSGAIGVSGVTTSGRQRRVVVVGNGMVGYRFCERLRRHDDAMQFDVVVFGEEPRPAYDRVQLTKYFETRDPTTLELAPASWYEQNAIRLLLGQRAMKIDRRRKVVISSNGTEAPYDSLVLATGSVPFVPPVPGMDKIGVFVYRTIEDLEAIIEYSRRCRRVAVLGGGLLGLEAAKAVSDLGLETHVVEFAPRLMPRQLDQAGAALLARKIEQLGVKIHTGRNTARVTGDDVVTGLRFADGERLDVDMVVVSAGIRPRDDMARDAGLRVGDRGGIVVDERLRTSDPDIYAVGECALFRGNIFGLVAPGYEMAEIVAQQLCGQAMEFTGADMSTKLKLLGVDMASFGDALANTKRSIVYEDLVKGIYKKLVLSEDGTRLIGGCLVGDVSEYAQLHHLMKTAAALPPCPEDLILGQRGGAGFKAELPDEAQVCSCNNVSKGQICSAIRERGITALADVKSCTGAGTGCGGCLPLVTDLLSLELSKAGRAVKSTLCEHFEFTRQELFHIVRVKNIGSFEELLADSGTGNGCEICKPVVASILASTKNDLILQHDHLQDTNDRFLANIQRQGLYSIVPRVPGGEITPEKLIVLGQVAKKYGLYTKITGGQRVDLFGARVEQLPEIWEELVDAGFESGHAYGKALRTVKSCVGSTWCRFGVQDSVGMAVRLEERYKGIRAPHKLKSAVSGCVRECAEAQSKDFALIATEKGYNVYVCGNGGAKPRHADLLIADVSEQDAIRYLDRFIMYYIRTADKLTRTSVWLDKLEGGIEQLRDVVLHDRLGICAELEMEMSHLVNTYQCEWTAVVRDPALRAKFRHFANSAEGDANIQLVPERGAMRPADWQPSPAPDPSRVRLPMFDVASERAWVPSWVKVARAVDFPKDAGMAVKYGALQIAVFNFTSRGSWYAVQNQCPHKKDMVLARGIIGDQAGVPKVACPLHKKTFSLEDGQCLSGEAYSVVTFPVKIEDGDVLLELPPLEVAERLLAPERPAHDCVSEHAAPPAE